MFRRIAAACALIAVVAMGFAASAQAGFRADEQAAASASGRDTAQAIVPARRVRARPGAETDGRPHGTTRASVGLFRSWWLATTTRLDAPVTFAVPATAPVPPDALPALALAPRTSRGPPPQS